MRPVSFSLRIALAAACAIGFAQPPRQKKQPAKPAPKAPAAAKPASKETVFPIETLDVKGSKYPVAEIVKVLGLKVGQPLTQPDAEAARDRLILHGAFSNVSYRYEPAPSKQGYAVTFEVTDYEQMIPYKFERLAIDEGKVRAELKAREPMFGDKIPTNQPVLDRFRANVESLAGAGVKVQAKITSDAAGNIFLLFIPAGSLPTVAEVRFEGNEVIAKDALQRAVHGSAIGVEFNEQRFRDILDASVRPLYESRGRLGVKFPTVETSAASGGVRGLAVKVSVSEGPSYSFGDIEAEGIESGPELVKASGLSRGDVANMDAVREGQEKMVAAMKRRGYLNAKARNSREVDDKKKLCGVTFHIDLGPEFHFGKLYTKGLDVHGEHEIKRIWGMKAGQVFNGDYPDFFLAKVKEEGIFDDLRGARAEVSPKADNTVDVTLIFNERKPAPGLK